MTPVTSEILERAIEVLATDGISEEEIETEIASFVSDSMTAQRLIDWIPDAFALAFISHIARVQLPNCFSALTTKEGWKTFALTKEPIFAASFQIAVKMCHNGPREILQNVSLRSADMDTVNQRLAAGGSLDGGVLSGPVLLGIPAEVYQDRTTSFWRRWFN